MTDTITIIGIVGTEPEQRSHNGTLITTFRVGSPQRRFDRASGTWTETGTNWYTVSAYRRLAEHAFASLHKRDRVILTGRLRVRNWDTGEKKGTSVDIDLDGIGHDLLFGTTTFTQAESSSSRATHHAEDAWEVTAPAADEDAWANPGIDPLPAAPSEQRTLAEAERAPALAEVDGPF